jgi:hypothetical protein
MPLIANEDVKSYTEFQVVKERCDNEKIKHDILKAEMDIYSLCGHKFEEYTEIPEPVQLVCIQLAEYYAILSVDESNVKGYVSEKIGDYSYQMNSDGSFKKPQYLNLLKDYIKTDTSTISTKVRFRMRAI